MSGSDLIWDILTQFTWKYWENHTMLRQDSQLLRHDFNLKIFDYEWCGLHTGTWS